MHGIIRIIANLLAKLEKGVHRLGNFPPVLIEHIRIIYDTHRVILPRNRINFAVYSEIIFELLIDKVVHGVISFH